MNALAGRFSGPGRGVPAKYRNGTERKKSRRKKAGGDLLDNGPEVMG
jgi:hypothetical protein